MGSSAHVHGKRIVAVVILVEMVALLPGQAATETETSSSIHSPGTTVLTPIENSTWHPPLPAPAV